MSALTSAPHTVGRMEDLEWMARTGENRIGAARRLGITVAALDRYLYRHQRTDLYRALTANDPLILRTHERRRV